MLDNTKKRFRVAFSFTGEKRAFVAEVARILGERFGETAILYDKYHEAEFARRDLGIYLPELYHKQSELVVVVICPEYDQKEWTGLEWTAIHDLLKQRKHNEVMLCRFERAEVSGLYSTAGFVDLDDKTPQPVADLILERLALNEGKPKNYYTSNTVATDQRLTTSIPNNLPRIQAFFGRTEELKQIADALDPESRTWGALIDGPGGMGKTSLAVRAAYDCSPDQFERIIFLSVKDRELDDDGERQLGSFILPGFLEMLNELSRQLGQPDIMKVSESERIGLILDALRPTRTLLILDNLESLTKSDRDQLFTFVKRLPQGCKAILTSRRRIGSSADVLILSTLDEGAALETLTDIARHNPLLARTSEAERRSLYAETGGNPLLLRWTAGQLGRGSCRTLKDAFEFLRSCPAGNDPLEFVFGDLAKEFTAEETRILVALTYFTLPTKLEHIATVADLELPLVETGLRTLANRSLVVPDQEEMAFALVPMVGDFLRRNDPEVVADTANRLEKRAYALIVENGYAKHDRFAVLDAQWPTVAPAIPLFIAGPNERLQTICDALRFFLEFTLRWDEWLSLEQQAEAPAVAANDYLSAGWRAYQGGWVHHLRHEGDAILSCAARAAEHWEIAQAGQRERARAIHLRGLGYVAKQDYGAAITTHREALDLDRKWAPESRAMAATLSSLASAERQNGDLVAAEQHFREAIVIARKIKDPEAVATHLGNLAHLMHIKKDFDQAENLAQEALMLSEQIGRQGLIASNNLRLARAMVALGKKIEAHAYAQRAVQVFEQLNDSQTLKVARETLAECEG
ncbi:MAG TPA: tetratricopeptide repeat protein [Pyrinomonadaceae bacterium]|nr:tetratricopeptide repeat protein [Pyrinomonadaceae bacterium]